MDFYLCTFCKKSFRLKIALNKHKRGRHLEEIRKRKRKLSLDYPESSLDDKPSIPIKSFSKTQRQTLQIRPSTLNMTGGSTQTPTVTFWTEDYVGEKIFLDEPSHLDYDNEDDLIDKSSPQLPDYDDEEVEDSQSWSCPNSYCNKIFLDPDELTGHLVICKPIEEIDYDVMPILVPQVALIDLTREGVKENRENEEKLEDDPPVKLSTTRAKSRSKKGRRKSYKMGRRRSRRSRRCKTKDLEQIPTVEEKSIETSPKMVDEVIEDPIIINEIVKVEEKVTQPMKPKVVKEKVVEPEKVVDPPKEIELEKVFELPKELEKVVKLPKETEKVVESEKTLEIEKVTENFVRLKKIFVKRKKVVEPDDLTEPPKIFEPEEVIQKVEEKNQEKATIEPESLQLNKIRMEIVEPEQMAEQVMNKESQENIIITEAGHLDIPRKERSSKRKIFKYTRKERSFSKFLLSTNSWDDLEERVKEKPRDPTFCPPPKVVSPPPIQPSKNPVRKEVSLAKPYSWKKKMAAHHEKIFGNSTLSLNQVPVIQRTGMMESRQIQKNLHREEEGEILELTVKKKSSSSFSAKQVVVIENPGQSEVRRLPLPPLGECPICKKRFYVLSELTEHVNLCEFSQNLADLIALQIEMQKFEHKHQCLNFPVPPNSPCSIPDHSSDPYKFEDEEVNKWSCTTCSKCFSKKRGLTAHIKNHTRPYSCPYCPKTFGKSYNRKLHLTNHRWNPDGGHGI